MLSFVACLLMSGVGSEPVSARSGPAQASVESLLDRAREHLGAPLPRGLRVLYLGTGDAAAVYQGQDWRKPEPRRHQSTVILDFAGSRGALRSENTRSDGTPGLFRNRLTPDGGTSVNLVSGLAFPMSQASAQQAWKGLAWQVPHYALEQLSARREHLRVQGERQVRDRRLVAAEFTPAAGPSFTVLFDAASGALAGYEYSQPQLLGPTLHRFLFKPYRDAPGLGRFPSGHVHDVGDRTYLDLDVFDVRSSPEVTQHPWLNDSPPQKREASTSKPAETTLQQLAPGVVLLRRIGAYNALLVEVGDCVAVVDAPASFAAVAAVPVASPPQELGERILALVRERLNKSVCYVVPTHHHADHAGAVGALARAGATVLASPPDVELMQRLAGPGGRVEAVGDVRGLGPIELHRLPGGPHVGEMLFAYVPAIKAVFEADNADYVSQSRRLVRYAEERHLAVETVYSVHSSSNLSLADLLDEEPSN